MSADPAQAIVPERTKSQLAQLSRLPDVAVAVISARSCSHLYEDFGDSGLILAGNYGLEIAFPDRQTLVCPAAHEARNALQEALDTIRQQISHTHQAIIEDHGYSVCVHHHLCQPDVLPALQSMMEQLCDRHHLLSVRKLPTSYEIVPAVEWDKGRALDLIDTYLEASGLVSPVCLYVGDSDYDEPAFDWVNSRNGWSFRVGECSCTAAQRTIESPTSVHELIEQLLVIRGT